MPNFVYVVVNANPDAIKADGGCVTKLRNPATLCAEQNGGPAPAADSMTFLDEWAQQFATVEQAAAEADRLKRDHPNWKNFTPTTRKAFINADGFVRLID